MKDQDSNNTGRRTVRRVVGAVAAVAALGLGYGGAIAETQVGPGAGTQYRGCVDQSWKDYNQCLGDADGWFSRSVCDLAWEADVFYCAAVLKRQLMSGSN